MSVNLMPAKRLCDMAVYAPFRAAMISILYDNIGRLIEYLKDQNLDENKMPPHEYLFWQRGISKVVRNNEFKLVMYEYSGVEILYDLNQNKFLQEIPTKVVSAQLKFEPLLMQKIKLLDTCIINSNTIIFAFKHLS